MTQLPESARETWGIPARPSENATPVKNCVAQRDNPQPIATDFRGMAADKNQFGRKWKRIWKTEEIFKENSSGPRRFQGVYFGEFDSHIKHVIYVDCDGEDEMAVSKDDVKQNVTISLSRRVLKKARILAARRETSISGLLAQEIARLASEEEAYERAERQALALLAKGFHLGGGIRVSRDELHER
jgi:hypothetical protein